MKLPDIFEGLEPDPIKKCPRCKTTKSIHDFRHRHEGNGTRIYTHCKQCEIDLRQESRKVAVEATEKPTQCESCGEEKPLQMDHCHSRKRFRGWICASCNSSYGMVGTFEKLKKLYEYAVRCEERLDKD